jgi:ATP-dependent RNA helicase HelY
LWPSLAIYDWARGAKWEWIIRNLRIAEGDFAMLISRTADNLNQLASLKDTHPAVALRALDAKQMILREPVVFDTW